MAHQSGSVHEESGDVITVGVRPGTTRLRGGEVSIGAFKKEMRFFKAHKLHTRARSY
jgi:hypothetical protein